jgi:hypothetical protein
MSQPNGLSERLAQILDALQEPFPSAYIEWKPQSVSKDGKRALAAAYVDARRYQERLDLVCPGWSSHIELAANGQVAKVAITIEGVTREDVGEASAEEANTVTTAVAQAFKRACAAFGLGRYLYFLPQQWCDYDAEKRRIINPPTLPEWALPSGERLERQVQAAAEREAQLEGRAGMSAGPEPADEPSGVATLSNPGEFVMPAGKYQGKTLAEIAKTEDGQDYLRWFANLDGRGYQGKGAREAQCMVRAFLTLQSAYAG